MSGETDGLKSAQPLHSINGLLWIIYVFSGIRHGPGARVLRVTVVAIGVGRLCMAGRAFVLDHAVAASCCRRGVRRDGWEIRLR